MFQRRKKQNFGRSLRYVLLRHRGYKRALRYLLWRLKRLPGSPEFIAKGFAIGIAVNFWPVLFTHLILGYIFCRLLRASVLGMLAGTLVGNPGTFALIYPLMYKIGKVVLGLKFNHREEHLDSAEKIWSHIWPIESWHNLAVVINKILFPMVVGGFLLGLPCTIAAYYLVRNGVEVYQTQHRKRLLRRFEAVENEIVQ